MSSWLIALVAPLNLVMLVTVIVAGLVSAWWLFPPGLLLWLIMVWQVARSPSSKINEKIMTRQPLPPRFQTRFSKIQRAQLRVFNIFNSFSGQNQKLVRPLQKKLDTLVDEVYHLCLRTASLENYFSVSASTENLNAEIHELEEKIKQTENPAVKADLEEACKSLRERMDKSKSISAQLERVDAQLLDTGNNIEILVADIFHLQTLNKQEAQKLIPEIILKIDDEIKQIKNFKGV